MKKHIILVFIFSIINLNYIMAQDNYNYQDDWKKVEDFDRQGLPKSALEVVETIHNKARKANNTNQITKTLIYKAKYNLVLEENAQLNIIKELKSEIENSKFPSKNILQSILANLYWQYFQENRWQFYNRTKTAEKVDQEDFRTWDLETLFAEIHLYYQKSLENGLLAQQTDLTKFNDILTQAEDSKIYRPTLYDFLSHNALAFYKTSETSITKPSYAFEINNPDYLKSYKLFSTLNITTKDTLSLQFHALKIYQNLINFHKRDKKADALIEVNIERLKFVHTNATFNDKQELLLASLISEKEAHQNHASSTLYNYEIANLYRDQAATYIPKEKETYRWELKKAIEVCDAAITKFPKSRGANNCANLKEQILDVQINTIRSENYVSINKPSRLLVNYKNLEQLYFKVLKINQNQLKSFGKIYDRKKQIDFLNKLAVITSWDSKLIDEKDYQNHRTEILVPKLTQGTYLIIGSTTKDLSEKHTFAFGNLQVTNLTLIENKTAKKTTFQVVDRNNGAPIANATIHLYSENRRNSLDKKLTTNEKGEAYFSKEGYFYNVLATVSKDTDKARFGGLYLNRYADNNTPDNNTRHTTFLFTDRSIYRPGQTVYFKGIMMASQGSEDPKIVPNTSTFAKLIDVNGQEVNTLNFKTNAYGSFAGEFILPSSGLTGNYTIQTDNYHSTSISVEEYKRPKFETSFKPVTETIKINDTITLTGTATAYAGSNITDAKVVYRVHRKVQYPRWCYWFPRYSSESQEITHGETKTNDTGTYTIRFAALPDKSVPKENQPTFIYEITADVTDINGETRSTTSYVNVGYHALTATINIPSKIDKTKKDNTLNVTTRNLNNEFVANSGTLKIYKLEAPECPLRNRPWKAPDYSGFTKEEFKKLFPHDAYQNEDDYRNWEKGSIVLDTTYDTKETKGQTKGTQDISLGNIKRWESGNYVIELHTKDRFGQEVKDVSYINLFDQSDDTISDSGLFSITTDKTTYDIGSKVLLKLSSGSEDITITLDIEKNHQVVETKLIKLSNSSKTITIPVSNEDLGGFAVSYSFVNYNGYQSGTIPIAVPYAPTELTITTKTFRDKLQPGQQETWSFTIKGPKGDKVTAELLASMYDASLDQFRPHQWYFNPINRPVYYSYSQRKADISFTNGNFNMYPQQIWNTSFQHQGYDQLNWFGLYFANSYRFSNRRAKSSLGRIAGQESAKMSMAAPAEMADDAELEEVVVAANALEEKELERGLAGNEGKNDEPKEPSLEGIKIRKNLQETAFFFPQLTTDPEGNVSFNFTAPEALTKWKLQLLAHTKQLNAGTQLLETVTQKELMILPNPPRFLREGDQIVFSTKVSNISAKDLTGIIELQLVDPLTGKSIDADLQNTNIRQDFSVKATGNTNVSWELQIPDTAQAVQYKIVAKAGEFSDGEQNALPVLSNRMLVTETLPMWIRSDQTKTFTLDKLKKNTSTTLKNHKLTLEMTSNPAWYAVQALPYLMEYPYECAEQTFSRYYANALASHIANSNPRIQEVFNQWKNTDALVSNLEKNQELKSLIIQETPWLRDAQSETEQKKRIALLFDLNKMNNELDAALKKLQQMQFGSGGFPWFKGGRENRYITQHIATGFGHLQKLGVTRFDNNTKNMLQRAVQHLDKEFVKEYKELKKYCKKNKVDINKDHLSYTQLHYLYMRSFFSDIKRANDTNEAWNYYLGQSKKYWLDRSLYAQGMLALILHRNNDTTTATKVIRSLDEKSITSDELGMYWKSNTASWYWYQAPIETQALMIEVFSEIEQEPKKTTIVDNLKVWLLKNKQTNRWQTTKATTEAVYALLLQGSDWLSVTDMVSIVLGNQKIDPSKIEDVKVEAGTGYFKTSWSGNEIQKDMATAKITKKGKGIAWGALYWQYFENLDKITSAKTPLQLKKKLFLKKNTDTGEEITEITDNTSLQLGDLVRVRIELRSDRAMEFVHMKDMRASGLEPINVISQYKYQDGLGYYESTKDASTNFFFDYLPKGVYVFEYDLRVNNKGDFSNGITTIQSMYAPEFSSHSEGVRVKVK
ncbi:alpha-2-macroglobulin family protein [Aquimarina sp. 2201CG14-23]|uniref:alpha-2-macroglobulin family protein n=1 Tax=Aquimarina mycalae TaxID=3040073 RepID=UPI002477FEF5|nr:MG2 domain-containing protein [Aquimarina sp. 2201CG14-23]MDH7444796.1 MG2 domain-containing protein [Aquimarina sp. 2201CG14-23]